MKTTLGKDHENKDTLLIEKGSDPEVLIISFGGMRGRLFMPIFEFYKTAKMTNFSKIFCRDSDQTWYHAGLDTSANTIQKMADKIQEEINKLQPKIIIGVGTSSGGYAALLLGHLLKFDIVYAFGSQTFLDIKNAIKHLIVPNARQIKRIINLHLLKTKSKHYFDLKKVLHNYNQKTKYFIHYSENCNLDCKFAKHLSHSQGVILCPHSCKDHNIVRYLKNENKLHCLFEKNTILTNCKITI